MNSDLDLQNGTGLAEVLKGNRLKVPLNQREYSWEEENVTEMLQDLSNSMSGRDASNFYFMGTIVMTKGGDEEWEIADGQQRLATTTIILAAIRDIFLERGEEKRATSFEQEFLFVIDAESASEVARLRLNADDNPIFHNRILLRPDDRPKDCHPKLASHRRILEAYSVVRKYFKGLEVIVGAQYVDKLLDWRKYLLSGAKVLLLKVPASKWAFIMFATMNDRGIKTSQVDLVKNHLFQEAVGRDDEAQRAWSSMRGIIESIGGDDDLVMEYMRWVACVIYGITREKEVFDKIADKSKGTNNAVNMLISLEGMAGDFAALFNSEHPKWNEYHSSVPGVIGVLVQLNVKQMRPLLLSIAKNFTPAQTAIALNAMISWAVRMTVAGGSKAGRLDTFYANLAYRVNLRGVPEAIGNYDELLAAAAGTLPNDNEFRSGFESIRVPVAKAARYYLRCLEQTAQGLTQPSWIPNHDPNSINLEHVMPRAFSDEFGVSSQDSETHGTRLGNLALIQSAENVKIDRKPFTDKKTILAESTFLLTEMIGKEFTAWGPAEIEARQKKLAEYAPVTWPLMPVLKGV
jgi:hypothetical protein